MDLTKKKCVPCEGGAAPLGAARITEMMPHVPGWVARDDKKIERAFTFQDFAGALAFVNKVGVLAEEEGHHPDIHLTGWKHVALELTTHAIGGLSENDFIMAAKINGLLTAKS